MHTSTLFSALASAIVVTAQHGAAHPHSVRGPYLNTTRSPEQSNSTIAPLTSASLLFAELSTTSKSSETITSSEYVSSSLPATSSSLSSSRSIQAEDAASSTATMSSYINVHPTPTSAEKDIHNATLSVVTYSTPTTSAAVSVAVASNTASSKPLNSTSTVPATSTVLFAPKNYTEMTIAPLSTGVSSSTTTNSNTTIAFSLVTAVAVETSVNPMSLSSKPVSIAPFANTTTTQLPTVTAYLTGLSEASNTAPVNSTSISNVTIAAVTSAQLATSPLTTPFGNITTIQLAGPTAYPTGLSQTSSTASLNSTSIANATIAAVMTARSSASTLVAPFANITTAQLVGPTAYVTGLSPTSSTAPVNSTLVSNATIAAIATATQSSTLRSIAPFANITTTQPAGPTAYVTGLPQTSASSISLVNSTSISNATVAAATTVLPSISSTSSVPIPSAIFSNATYTNNTSTLSPLGSNSSTTSSSLPNSSVVIATKAVNVTATPFKSSAASIAPLANVTTTQFQGPTAYPKVASGMILTSSIPAPTVLQNITAPHSYAPSGNLPYWNSTSSKIEQQISTAGSISLYTAASDIGLSTGMLMTSSISNASTTQPSVPSTSIVPFSSSTSQASQTPAPTAYSSVMTAKVVTSSVAVMPVAANQTSTLSSSVIESAETYWNQTLLAASTQQSVYATAVLTLQPYAPTAYPTYTSVSALTSSIAIVPVSQNATVINGTQFTNSTSATIGSQTIPTYSVITPANTTVAISNTMASMSIYSSTLTSPVVSQTVLASSVAAIPVAFNTTSEAFRLPLTSLAPFHNTSVAASELSTPIATSSAISYNAPASNIVSFATQTQIPTSVEPPSTQSTIGTTSTTVVYGSSSTAASTFSVPKTIIDTIATVPATLAPSMMITPITAILSTTSSNVAIPIITSIVAPQPSSEAITTPVASINSTTTPTSVVLNNVTAIVSNSDITFPTSVPRILMTSTSVTGDKGNDTLIAITYASSSMAPIASVPPTIYVTEDVTAFNTKTIQATAKPVLANATYSYAAPTLTAPSTFATVPSGSASISIEIISSQMALSESANSIAPSATSKVINGTTVVAEFQTLTQVAAPSQTPGIFKKYYQCGGWNFKSKGVCEAGSTCKYQNDWYWQCV